MPAEGRVTYRKRKPGACERAMTGRAVLDNFGSVGAAVTIPLGSKYCQGGLSREARQQKVAPNSEAPS